MIEFLEGGGGGGGGGSQSHKISVKDKFVCVFKRNMNELSRLNENAASWKIYLWY